MLVYPSPHDQIYVSHNNPSGARRNRRHRNLSRTVSDQIVKSEGIDLASLPKLDRPHHEYSPSTLQSLEACPCYRSKQSKVPHVRTIIGTIAHNVTETGEDDCRLDDNDASYVADCIDFYERRKQGMIQQYGGPVRELKEIYLSIDDEETTAGYPDCSIISCDERVAETFDWKFGRWPVEDARNNLQGIAYSLGMFRAFPKLEFVHFFFKQPVIDHITNAVFTREQIPALYLRVKTVVERAKEARRRLKADPTDFSMARPMIPNCNFCALLGTCTKVAEFACKIGSKFAPLQIPSDITPTKLHSPEDVTLGLQLAQVLSCWSNAFKDVIANNAISRTGPVPPGYRIAGRTPREIADHQKYKELALQHGLTEAEYEAILRPGLTAVEKIISNKAPRGSKTEAVEAFAEAALASGAVSEKDAYTFLQAIPVKANKNTET